VRRIGLVVACATVAAAPYGCSSFGAAATIIDAATDGPLPSCDAGTICDDFDRQEALGARWTRTKIENATLTLDETVSRSAPRSLRVVLGDAGKAVGLLEWELKPPKVSIECSFELRFNGRDRGGVIDIFALRANGAGITDYLLSLSAEAAFLRLRDDVTSFDGGCACPRYRADVGQLSRDAWRRVTIASDFRIVRVSVDGTPIYEGSFFGFAPASLSVRLGLDAPSAAAADVSFDDFVCELRD
jgi:hypothetical protein